MSTLSPFKESYLTYFLLLLTVLNLYINYLYRQQLYKMGAQMIAQFQRSQNLFLTTLFLILTTLIDPSVVIAIAFTLIILVKKKQSSFTTVIWILLNALAACILKAFYADPRPFWTHQEIKSIGIYCPVEYGNPSGHSWFSVTIGMGFLVERFGVGESNRNIYISLALMIFVPMSRMYLGAHSLNQVIQGVFLGLVMVLLYRFCSLKNHIHNYLKNFHSTPGHKWKKLTIIIHLVYITGFLLNYDSSSNPFYKTSPQEWKVNIISECNHIPTPGQLNFTMLMLNSLIINFMTGIAYGYEEITNSIKGKVYLSGNWLVNQQRYALWCGYLLFFVIEFGLLMVGFLPAVIAVYFFGFNEIVIFLFGNVGAFLAGYLYTSKSWKVLFEKKVIREEIA